MPAAKPTRRLLASTALALAGCAGAVAFWGYPTPSIADDIPTNDAGERHGRVTLEHPNGETHVLATYREGQLHGTYREFSDTGRLTLQATFREGKLHGRLERYTPEGQRLEIARYREGQREGTRQVFRDGAVVLTETYEDGQRSMQEGDASADPGPPVFAVGPLGHADEEEPAAGPNNDAPDRPQGRPPGQRPEHQRDTSRKPNGYPYSIDEITRAFGRIDNLRIEGNPDDQQAAAIRRLIKSRLVCGIEDPILAFDREEAHLAQRACEVCHALGRLSHEPPNPGLPEDVYRPGYEGASRGNLASGDHRGPADSIEGWLIDPGSNNRDEIGHRRWCLTPGLYETAYGHHEGYTSLLVVGNVRDHVDYDIITYPGPGYQPVEFYDGIHRYANENLIWSIHLNPQKYQTPPTEQWLRVSVYRVLPNGDKLEVEVSRTRIAEQEHLLETILFDPEIEIIEPGAIYEVSIQGIEHRRRPHTITYRVEFFALGNED